MIARIRIELTEDQAQVAVDALRTYQSNAYLQWQATTADDAELAILAELRTLRRKRKAELRAAERAS